MALRKKKGDCSRNPFPYFHWEDRSSNRLFMILCPVSRILGLVCLFLCVPYWMIMIAQNFPNSRTFELVSTCRMPTLMTGATCSSFEVILKLRTCEPESIRDGMQNPKPRSGLLNSLSSTLLSAGPFPFTGISEWLALLHRFTGVSAHVLTT